MRLSGILEYFCSRLLCVVKVLLDPCCYISLFEIVIVFATININAHYLYQNPSSHHSKQQGFLVRNVECY